MSVRQQQDGHCLNEVSLPVFGRTIQLINERRSRAEYIICSARTFGLFLQNQHQHKDNTHHNTYFDVYAIIKSIEENYE